jgi:hypothetical protein
MAARIHGQEARAAHPGPVSPSQGCAQPPIKDSSLSLRIYWPVAGTSLLETNVALST